MKKIRMKLMSGFISMIMAVNLIAPVSVYASVVNDDDTVIEETVTQEEENLDEQMTTTSPDETEKNDEDIQQEETDEVTPTGTVEENTETETSSPFSESKTIGDVTITVKAEAGAFPNDSYLEVKEIASNTDMSSENETLAASYSYDITIYDKDGNEIEPAEGKNVTVSFSMDRIADSNLDTNIYHTSDDGTVTELDITTSGDTATATTDSFSVYTVEFTYGELTYVMNGDSSIKLSDILNSVSLTGQATNVECSDTSLFSASNESGEWIISSHKAFSTTEWMKVTIEDIVYEIKVTDAQTGTCGTNLTWTLDGGTLTISGTGAMADYDNYRDIPWYSQKAYITTVVISDGVTSIGDHAFESCRNLTSITIPNGVTSIGESAFAQCSSLTSITIPNSVTSIGGWAFYYCSRLTSITIPDSVNSIGPDAFDGIAGTAVIYYEGTQTDLDKVTGKNNIPTANLKLRSEGGNCGANGDNVKWSYFDDGTLVIRGTGAMADYTDTSNAPWYSQRPSIKNVVISDGVTSIGEEAFKYCSKLTSITIPNSVTSIDEEAFEYCSKLTSITIPNSVTSIGNGAFKYCRSLTSITIPSSVTSIGEGTFFDCTKLTSITIPNSVTSIGNQAFQDCTGLTSITIPASVTSIGNRAFQGCRRLTSITIPDSVTSIGNDAFFYCSDLTSIAIPASVTSMGQSAFLGIASNAVIDFGGTQAQWDSFGITFATTVTVRCALLAAGNCGANGDNVKWLLKNDGTLEISGSGDMANYNNSSNVPWYSQRYSITTVVISDGVTSIGVYAFADCSALTSITIPNGVTSIGDVAFRDCSSLSSITIPSSVTSIGDGVFAYCSALTSITIPSGVTSIGKWAFYSCTNLTSITIPTSVTSIGEDAFWRCISLTSITIPASVTSIGSSAFYSMGLNATNPTINFGGTKARWDAFGSDIQVGRNVTVNCTKLDITIKAKDQSVALGSAISNTISDVEITSGKLDTGHTLEGITLDAVTSNVTTSGVITPKNAVIKAGTTDINVEDNYNITYVNGTLTVTKGNPVVTAPTAKTGLVYDGTEQKLVQAGSTTGGTLKYSLSATGTYSTDIPKAKNAGPYTVFYKVEGNDNYNGDNGGSVAVTIGTKPLTITADSATRIYDGTALTKNSYTNTSLASGDSISSVTITGSQTVFGNSNNVASAAVIKNAAGDDVTSSYDITYANGTLKVTQKDLTITADDATKTYDGTALTKNSYTNTALATGDNITSVTITGSQTVFGNSNNVASAAVIKNAAGDDVTSSYNITYTNGTLKVNKKDLTITAGSDSKTYDGTALTKNSYTNTALAAGDSISSVTITGSQTVFGNSNNVASAAVIKNAAGTDVTSSYNITYVNGTLTVSQRDVTVSVADKTVSYNTSEQTGNTSYTFANVAAGDAATITYTPAKGTDASATAYDNGSFADDFKVMSGSTDVTASYNLKSKTAGKLKINKAAITPTVTIKGWIVGNTPDIPTVTGNKGNGTETIEYKKSTEADTAYTGTVPTAEGTYTVRATIDETANYLSATATAEFKISAKPVVIDNDESDKKSSDDNNETPPDTGYETFMKELKAAAKKGTPQTLTLNWGNSLSYEAMQILKDNPQLTLIFNYKWQGSDYSTTIGGGRTVHANRSVPWYGPENLRGLYGASLGRRYVNSTGNTSTGTVNTPGNGVYVVQRGDSLWKIANRKLHVSVDYLVQKNNIRNRNRIITGMVLYY